MLNRIDGFKKLAEDINFLKPEALEMVLRKLTERIKKDGVRFDEVEIFKEWGIDSEKAKILFYEWCRSLSDRKDWLAVEYYLEIRDALERFEKDPASFNYFDRRRLQQKDELVGRYREATKIVDEIVYSKTNIIREYRQGLLLHPIPVSGETQDKLVRWLKDEDDSSMDSSSQGK